MTEDQPLAAKVFAKDGIWQVPPEERPANWEQMALKEPESAPWLAVATIQAPIEPPKKVAKKKPEPAPVISHPAPGHIIAESTSAEQIPGMHNAMQCWFESQLKQQSQEVADLTRAHNHAEKHKWATGALWQAQWRAMQRRSFLQKIVSALRAGYVLFPHMPNYEVFAVHSQDSAKPPKYEYTVGRDRIMLLGADASVPAGKGTYRGRQFKTKNVNKNIYHQGKFQDVEVSQVSAFDDIVFPFALARPVTMEATSRAMALNIFDEIGFLPPPPPQEQARQGASRPGDPVIVGTIINPVKDRRLSFLISWLLDTRDFE